jgi:hypothetical protein
LTSQVLSGLARPHPDYGDSALFFNYICTDQPLVDAATHKLLDNIN